VTDRILPLEIDYTARDFDSLKDRGVRLLQSVFPDWSDHSTASFANILHELLCYAGDVLSVYLDSAAREAFLSTCVQRVNGIRHGRRTGYALDGAEAATVDLQFTLAEVAVNSVTFDAKSIVRSTAATDPARVQLLSDLVIGVGQQQGTVSAENSLSYDEAFESDDTADQRFELAYTPYLEIVTLTDSVGAYTEVDNFFESGPTDRHLVVLVSEDDRALLVFGDGVNGKIPSGTIDVEYKTGGGAITIDPDTLTLAEFTAQDALGNSVAFSVTNPASSVGGSPAETLDEARLNIPDAQRAMTRTVAQEDYSIQAKRVSGVARALMLTSDQYAPLAENYGQLMVVARGSQLSSGLYESATPTATQLTDIRDLIENDYPKTITFRYDVIAAIFKVIDYSFTVFLDEGANPATVDAAIRSALADYFAVSDASLAPLYTIDFGYNYRDELGDADPRLPWGDTFTVVKGVSGVRRIDEDAVTPTDDVVLTVTEFPQLGSVTLINGRTGLPLV
jgi:hypothetical protein